MSEIEKVIQITVDGAGVFPGDNMFVSMITNAEMNSTRVIIYNCNSEVGRSACEMMENMYRWSPERYAFPRPLFGTEGNKALFGIVPEETFMLEFVGFEDYTERNSPPPYYTIASCFASNDKSRLYYRLTIINTSSCYAKGWDQEMFDKYDMNKKIAELARFSATKPFELVTGRLPENDLLNDFNPLESDGEYIFSISQFMDNSEVKKEEE